MWWNRVLREGRKQKSLYYKLYLPACPPFYQRSARKLEEAYVQGGEAIKGRMSLSSTHRSIHLLTCIRRLAEWRVCILGSSSRGGITLLGSQHTAQALFAQNHAGFPPDPPANRSAS